MPEVVKRAAGVISAAPAEKDPRGRKPIVTSRHSLEPRLTFNEAGHRYCLDGSPVPSVTQVLANAGMLDYSFLSTEEREFYLARGRAVHLAAEQHDLGNLEEDGLAPGIRPYLEAWRAFRRDYAFVPSLIEHRVCNRQHGYAGTIDRAGRIRGGCKVLLDIKTGTAPAAVRLQLAAYCSCLPHPRAYLRRAVELHEDATYKVIAFEASDYQRDLQEFLAALLVFKAREEQ